MQEPASILVAVDGSPSADKAVDAAVLLAKSSGAVLQLLYVSYFDSETDDEAAERIYWLPEEVPLAEDLESYDVQILDGAVVKRTLTSTTTSVLYTAAQQTTDWGALLGPGQTLAIRIYQLSNRLGRGDPAVVTLQF